jgi:agmatinase
MNLPDYGQPPYAGPLSFARAPSPQGTWEADVAVLGIPFDLALGYRPGARSAPRALREASLRYAPGPEGYYDPRRDRYRLAGCRIVDAGDVSLPALDLAETHRCVAEAASWLRGRCRLPVFLGGDHSVSYPLLLAYSELPAFEVVQIDAHLDFSDRRQGSPYTNSSPFRRACLALPALRRITTIGLRGLRHDPEAVAEAKRRGHRLIFMEDLDRAAELLPSGALVYLSIDVDALDPSFLPGTSSPEPGGLSYGQLVGLLAPLLATNRLIGLDLVELSPALDPSGLSSLVAARLLMEALCLWQEGGGP